MSRVIRFLSKIFDAIYKAGFYSPLLIILVMTAAGNSISPVLNFKLKLKMALLMEKIRPSHITCSTSRPSSVLEFSSGTSWQQLPDSFTLKAHTWYSAEKKWNDPDLILNCGQFSLIFSLGSSGGVFRLISTKFGLPIFEVSEKEVSFMLQNTPIGLVYNGWGHAFITGVEKLTVSGGLKNKISVDTVKRGAEPAFFILRKSGLNANNSLNLEWRRGQKADVFLSDRQAVVSPVEPYLLVD